MWSTQEETPYRRRRTKRNNNATTLGSVADSDGFKNDPRGEIRLKQTQQKHKMKTIPCNLILLDIRNFRFTLSCLYLFYCYKCLLCLPCLPAGIASQRFNAPTALRLSTTYTTNEQGARKRKPHKAAAYITDESEKTNTRDFRRRNMNTFHGEEREQASGDPTTQGSNENKTGGENKQEVQHHPQVGAPQMKSDTVW